MRRAVPPVLVPRRHPEPRRAGDARLDPRGRRARLRARRTPTARRSTTPTSSCAAWSATARPRPARWPRAGTRNKFLDPATRRRRAADPAPQRLQDRQPDRARAHPGGRAARAARGLRLPAVSSSRATTRTTMHQRMAAALDEALDEIAAIQRRARAGGDRERPRWPMIVLRTPKGWTGPEEVDGLPVEGTWRSHQVPLAGAARQPRAPAPSSRSGCASYRPEELFDERRRARADVLAPAPEGDRRMSANPHANGGRAAAGPATARLPRLRRRRSSRPATTSSEATRVLGTFLRDVMRAQPGARSACSGPTRPPRTGSAPCSRSPTAPGTAELVAGDDHLAPDGRVMEVLCEHLCQGWLEGYLLTGRHGLFNCYEAFIHIVDSMFNQHAKWLKVTRGIPWRRPIASLNYLLTSHVWRQDHNGFSHQDPGLHRPRGQQEGRGRPRLPAAGRQHPAVGGRPLPAQPRLRQRDRRRQAARARLARRWTRRSPTARAASASGSGRATTASGEPDVVLACAGDVPTLETLAAAALLREHLPELKVRVVNVVDLMRLQPDTEHPHGLPDARVRRAVHHRQAGDLRLPRLPVADPPAHLPPHQPPQPARARLQGGGHDHDAVRHGHAQRPRPLPPGHGRHRPRARARHAGAPALRQQMVDERLRAPRLHPRARRGPAGGARLDLAGADGHVRRAGRQRGLEQPQAARCSTPATTRSPSATLEWPRRRAEFPRDALDDLPAVDAVGHRVVHGGDDVPGGRSWSTTTSRARLRDARPTLAPLHQPRALAAIDALRRRAPDVAAVACFDTAFHATLPPAAATYALPAEWRAAGAARYGFHGLSHAYAARRAAELPAATRTTCGSVTCHLGAGASLAAVAGGRSVDTTMGFTPLEGLVMAHALGQRRPGPRAVAARAPRRAGAAELADALEHRSGLSAWPGPATCASCCRALTDDDGATLALDVYVHRLRAAIAAMAAASAGSTCWCSPAASASTPRRPCRRGPRTRVPRRRARRGRNAAATPTPTSAPPARPYGSWSPPARTSRSRAR